MLTAIVVGVVVFIAGQAFLRFVMEPIQHQRKVIGEIAFVHLMYANVYPPSSRSEMSEQEIQERIKELKEVSKELRKLAGDLRATLWTIPLYRLWAFLLFVKKKDKVLKASSNLIGWSNSLFSPDTHSLTEHRKHLRENLGLPDT